MLVFLEINRLPSYVVLNNGAPCLCEGFPNNMSDQFFYLRLKFIPKVGHTFTDEREVVIEVPKGFVTHKSKLINEGLKEVFALDLAKSVALGTFPTAAERALDLYDEYPPTWCRDRPLVMDERPCDHEQDGARAWRIV
jgi:hypothetical protein